MDRRKRMIVALIVGVMALLAVACAPTAPAPPAAEKPAAKEAAPEGPKLGGVARFATVAAPPNLNSWVSSSSAAVIGLFSGGPIYETLIGFDYTVKDFRADFPLVSKLAERWEVSSDGRSYTFKLRPGVQWHDAKPLRVEDVVWSLDYLRDPKNAFEGGTLLKDVERVEKLDEGSLRITLKASSPTFIIDFADELTNRGFFIRPKHLFDEGGAEALAAKGTGTGPFKVVKLDPSGTTVLARNENYWRKDAQGRAYPYIAGAEFVHNMERATQEAAFAAGELDLVHFQTKDQHDAVKKIYKDFDTPIHHTSHGTGLFFNISKKPFSDIRVRRAVHLALDRHELNETVGGGAIKISGPVVPGIKEGWGLSQEELFKLPGYRKDKTEDLKEAKRLLAEAGYPEGLKGVVFVLDRAWGSAFMADYIPTTLKRAGIEVEQRSMEGASAEKALREGDFNMGWRHIANEKPLLRLGPFFQSKGVWAKAAGINDPEMDRLIDELTRATAVEEQKKLVRRLAELQLERVYSANIGDPAFFRGEQKWFKNYRSLFTASVAPGGGLYQVWLDQDLMPAKRKR